MTAPILTVTLNPALDVTTTTGSVEPGRKLRCGAPRTDPGGGGINVSRTIALLGGQSRCLAVLGGATGARLSALLAQEGLDAEVIEIAGETRTSLTVMAEATGEHFRFVLPGEAVAEPDGLIERIAAHFSPEIPYVVLSGSILPGMPPNSYAQLVDAAHSAGTRPIFDAAGPALRAGLDARPYLVKLDIHEAAELLGAEITPDSAPGLAGEVVGRGWAEVAIITLLDKGSVVATKDSAFRLMSPQVTVDSPVGAGDSYIGALTLTLANGGSLLDAAAMGVAAATSTVQTPATSLCVVADVLRFAAEVKKSAQALT